MSAFSALSLSIAGLAGNSIVLMLICKWTVVLALAWMAHGILARCNPRWRVAVWRVAVVGVVMVAFLSSAPPIVEYRFVTTTPIAVEIGRSVSIAPTGAERATPGALSLREPLDASDPALQFSSVARTGGGTQPSSISQGAAPAPSAPAEGPGGRWAVGAGSWMGSIWLAGVLVLSVRLIVGSLGLARVVRRSSQVPDAITRECRAIAERLECRRHVRVQRTLDVPTPCLAGILRPVLLLPERECDDVRSDALRAILAHELAHARNHDLAWNLAAHVASIVLWFHPLAWRVRAAHAAACDAVCDAVAVDLLGDVISYGRTLARLAVRAARPVPAHGLAMARTSDVRSRLDALKRNVFRTPLSWRRVMCAICGASVLVVLIGGFGFTRTEQAAATSKADDADRPAVEKLPTKLTLRAVRAETNEPIEGVSIEYQRVRANKKNEKGNVTTGMDGTATIDHPLSLDTKEFGVTARMPKLVPIQLLWDDRRHPLELPLTKELRFEPGTTIGGIVKDEAGHPIEGAVVDVYAPPTEYEGTNRVFSLGKLNTDAQGRWHLDVAPRNLFGTGDFRIGYHVTHPRYRRNVDIASRDLDSTIVLTKGPTVTGRVIDAAGRPIKGARAIIGHDILGTYPPTGTTNERGEFILENCTAGPTIVTVQAEGFAPQIRDVRVEERTAPVEVKLTEPGSLVRGKVVDLQGKPVAGAVVASDTWRGHRSINLRVVTDKDGRFELKNAPKDEVLYDIFRGDFMRRRLISLPASGREQTVTLNPELVITGRVTDATTGRPLPKFRLILGQTYEGQKETYWALNEAVDITGGRYTARFDMPSVFTFVRVEAPGYQAADSRAFRSTEGSQTFDFALKRGGTSAGVVVLPNGKPAAGAEVVIDTRDMGWLMQEGHFDRRANVPTVTAGPDGRFTFTPPVDPFLLIAISDAGYARAFPDELAQSGKLVLQPWGKIEGELRIGGQPAPNQQVEFGPALFQRGGRTYAFTYGYSTLTDKLGRFAFDRVVPGPGTLSRSVPNAAASGGFRPWGWQGRVEVKSGQTTRVQLGGKGRPVLGRIVVHGTPETPVDWTKNQPVVIQTPLQEVKDPLDFRQFGSNIDKEGRFRVEDVPPGKYLLEITVNSDSYPQVRDADAIIGIVRMTITVPEAPVGRPADPLDLGTITAELFETLKVGDASPDFTVRRILGKGKGDELNLRDYQGKLVLLDYWATWCGPCRAEMPVIKDIQKTFGSDARFQLIGMSCDETAEVAQRYVKEHGLIWTHGFAGNLIAGASAGEVYKVRAIPATFLIGPDGRILAKNLRGAELKDAVRKALQDPKLFPVAAGTTQPASSR